MLEFAPIATNMTVRIKCQQKCSRPQPALVSLIYAFEGVSGNRRLFGLMPIVSAALAVMRAYLASFLFLGGYFF